MAHLSVHVRTPPKLMEVDVNEVACNKAIEGAFNLADASKKGYLARKEYKIAVTALLGYKPSKLECERVLSEHGSSKVLEDGSTVKIIPFVTFKVLMVPKIYQRDSDELIRQIFLALDIQCRGFLTIEEVIQGFHEVIPTMPQHQIKQFFKEIDLDEDGRISYKDFELMMKQRKLLK